MNDVSAAFEAAEGSWPEDRLEELGRCPICRSSSRTVLLGGLRDDVFRCAPGTWCLHRCLDCLNAYLDPRPNRESIMDAYRGYYTHVRPRGRANYATRGRIQRLRRRAANGYTNQRYGTCFVPESRIIGRLLAYIPVLRHALDLKYRWLPRPTKGARLLDVGCGNGAFLKLARDAGWEAFGVDPDPGAIRQVVDSGINARVGDISVYAGMKGTFDAVTFSHSIEHMHDPVAELRVAWMLLKPGGMLYLDTPDVDSCGRKRFRAKWRGIEAPRHLVLFSAAGLKRVLESIGYGQIRSYGRFSASRKMGVRSLMLKLGRSPYEPPSRRIRLLAQAHAITASLFRSPDFITLTCTKVVRESSSLPLSLR